MDPVGQTLWRISNHPDLSGKGGLKASGRWHSKGRKVVYLADSSSGALLEVLVHLQIDSEDIPDSFSLLQISVPGSIAIPDLAPPPGETWKYDQVLTRQMGDEWLSGRTSALLRVPSSIVTGAWIVLFNPAHSDADRLEIAAVTREKFDKRLFRFGAQRFQ